MHITRERQSGSANTEVHIEWLWCTRVAQEERCAGLDIEYSGGPFKSIAGGADAVHVTVNILVRTIEAVDEENMVSLK
jgi:hypothetical protein